jgi:5-methylcytosine-specific restriction endonuclease McrA
VSRKKLGSSARRRLGKRVMLQASSRCTYCRRLLQIYHHIQYRQPDSMSLDHIVESRNGGAWADYNLLAACQPCNKNRDNLDMTAVEYFFHRRKKEISLNQYFCLED